MTELVASVILALTISITSIVIYAMRMGFIVTSIKLKILKIFEAEAAIELPKNKIEAITTSISSGEPIK